MTNTYRLVKTVEVDIEVVVEATSIEEAQRKADKIVEGRIRHSGDLLIFTMGNLSKEEADA